MMNRRDILKQLAVISGGLMLVPSCDFSKNDIITAYDHLKVTKSDKELLQHLTNVIIPSDKDFKGADELELSDFILVMINDCYGPDDQESYIQGLKKINQHANEQTRQNLQSLSTDHAEELIQNILDHPGVETAETDNAAQDFQQIQYCIKVTKSLTIQGYMASEYMMTGRMPYELVPGKFEGKVLIKEGEKVNIYG